MQRPTGFKLLSVHGPLLLKVPNEFHVRLADIRPGVISLSQGQPQNLFNVFNNLRQQCSPWQLAWGVKVVLDPSQADCPPTTTYTFSTPLILSMSKKRYGWERNMRDQTLAWMASCGVLTVSSSSKISQQHRYLRYSLKQSISSVLGRSQMISTWKFRNMEGDSGQSKKLVCIFSASTRDSWQAERIGL